MHICSSCQTTHLSPSLFERKLASGALVYSFYQYGEIEDLLHTKHTPLGYYIYTILAQLAFKKFSDHFHFNASVASLSIDDHTRSGYSHTAILNKHLRSKVIFPYYGKMRAKNRVSYSGQSYEFRLLNPRAFNFLHVNEEDVILVDDIITTGSTLNEASSVIYASGKNLLFCLALASVEKEEAAK
jgi:competence protein ComFC